MRLIIFNCPFSIVNFQLLKVVLLEKNQVGIRLKNNAFNHFQLSIVNCQLSITLLPFFNFHLYSGKSFLKIHYMKAIVKLLLMLSFTTVTSCLRDDIKDHPCPCEDEKKVVIKLTLPFTAPETRSMDATQENAVQTLDVLAFNVENGTETFLYWADATNLGSGTGLSFTATVRLKNTPQRFVFISNARDKVKELLGMRDDHWVGIEKEDMLSKLTVKLGADNKWKAIDAFNYTAIPMWGQTDPKIIDETTTTLSSAPIKMLRMIAKIEVAVDKTVPGLTNNFKLKSVYLYNTNTSGRITPKQGTEYVGADMIARLTSEPASVSNFVGPIEFKDFSAPGETDVAIRGAIYLFERAAKNNDSFLDETCIVVGGLYGTDTNPTYYRLDFLEQDGKTYMDMLRNNRYNCKIIEVTGPGAPTVDDAFRTKSVNIQVEILVWNEGNISDITFDGQYMLSISQNPFVLSEDAHTLQSMDNFLYITTDHPDGWTSTVSLNKYNVLPCSWLSVVPTVGKPNELRLLLQENPVEEDRTAYIHIKAGQLTYIVTVVQMAKPPVILQGTYVVTPNQMLLPHTIPASARYELLVECRYPDGSEAATLPWTLTSNDPSWCRLSLSPTTAFASASTTITSNGSKQVYIIASNNGAITSRSTFIYKEGNASEVATNVTQWGNTDNITGNEGFGNLPTGVFTYVGAFWRANQTGERFIRVNMGANAANRGDWTATVIWLDPRWQENDGVVLSTERSAGMPGGNSAISGDAESYQVQGYNTTVSGNIPSSNPWESYIIFRIGLKSRYTPTDQYPARYAVVLLSYANNTRHHKIFLRQGEDADYLFSPSDPVNSGGVTSRTKAKKFTTRNLTAETLDARTAKAGTSGANPAIFADYPTQAGAYFQWANEHASTLKGGMRWAYAPHVDGTYNTAFTYGSARAWSLVGSDNEVSPNGYRRPTDGIINGSEPCTSAANSELRQSLFRNPKTSYNNVGDIGNSVTGYYADGFFDRRVIGVSPTGIFETTVASGTRDIAYAGRLFFNVIPGSDHFNASLFFPHCGALNDRNAQLLRCGIDGFYWTASRNGDCGLSLIIRNDGAGSCACPWRVQTILGGSIRCVKD
jgi:hypothetical protein